MTITEIAKKLSSETAQPKTQAEINKIAADVKKGGTPDAMNRWLDMTPAKLTENEAARANLAKAKLPKKKSEKGKSSVALGHAKNLDETGKAILSEQKKAKEQSKMERLKQLRAQRAEKLSPKDEPMAKRIDGACASSGRGAVSATPKKVHPADAISVATPEIISKSKEFQATLLHSGKQHKQIASTLAEAVEAGAKLCAKFKSDRKPIIHAVWEGRAYIVPSNHAPQQKESNVKTKSAAPAKKAAEAKKSAAPKNGNGAKKLSKMDQATDMLKRAKGASQKELFELTGWKYTNVKELAERASMKLVQDGERYRLTA